MGSRDRKRKASLPEEEAEQAAEAPKERYTFDNSINSKVLCFAFGLVAEIERNLISMRTKEALALKRAEGVRLGRRPGSDVKMQVIRDNSDRIEAMLASGMTVTKICRKIGISRNTWYKFQSQIRA